MRRETITTTASPGSATPVAPFNYDDKIETFAAILTRIEAEKNRDVITVLAKIEENTAVLKKLKPGNLPAIATATAKEESPFPRQRLFDGAAGVLAGRTPASQRRDSQGRFVGKATGPQPAGESSIPFATARLATEEDLDHEQKRRKATSTASASTIATAASPEPVHAQGSAHETSSERDNRGRFVGKSKSQEARSEQRNKDEKKSLLESLRDGIGSVGAKGKSAIAANAGTIEEAAGRAAGGPIFEAAMELKGAVDSARDEDSMIGKAARWAGRKTGILKGEEEKTSTASASTIATAASPEPVHAQGSAHETSSERDNRGRFVGKSKSQEARSEQRNKDEKKSLLESLRDGIGSVGAKGKSAIAANAGTIEEAAGRAAGGPIFEAAMELKGAVDSISDEDSMISKAARWAGKKTGISKGEEEKPSKEGRDEKGRFLTGTAKADDGSKKIIETLKGSENEDEKRHEELIKAILKGNKDEGRGPKSMGLPYSRETGPGAVERRRARKEKEAKKTVFRPKSSTKKGSLAYLPNATMPGSSGPGGGGGGLDIPAPPGGLPKILKTVAKVLPVLAALPLGTIAAGVTAVGAVASAGYSAATGKDNPISKLAQAAGLVPKLETDANGKIVAGAVATASESGKGGAGTISTGKNDAGGASYGKKQLASAGGMNSSVAQFVRQSSHAEEFKGLMPGTPEFNQKWKEIAGKDKNFGNEQDAYVAKTMSAPVIARAVKGGFNTEDVGIREALISQSIQHGLGGNKKILQGAQDDLIRQYGSVEAASATAQIDALTKSRKNYVNRVAEGKTQTAQGLRAKGDEKGALKAEGEAKQLRSIAGAGGRYDKENAIVKELSATGGIVGKTAIAQKQKVVEPVVEGEAIREKASATELATTPVSMATATATPVKDMRQRIFARTRARTVALGGGSLEAKPIEVGAMATEPATVLATGMPARSVRQPERMTTARAEIQEAPSSIPGPKQVGSDVNGMVMAALDKLNATMAKMTGQDEAKRSGVPPIRTEFDDTMLTLMAYDRI